MTPDIPTGDCIYTLANGISLFTEAPPIEVGEYLQFDLERCAVVYPVQDPEGRTGVQCVKASKFPGLYFATKLRVRPDSIASISNTGNLKLAENCRTEISGIVLAKIGPHR